jgi:hypothetical protein
MFKESIPINTEKIEGITENIQDNTEKIQVIEKIH